MIMSVIAAWAMLALLAAAFVAAVGRSGLREEQARDRLRTDAPMPEDSLI